MRATPSGRPAALNGTVINAVPASSSSSTGLFIRIVRPGALAVEIAAEESSALVCETVPGVVTAQLIDRVGIGCDFKVKQAAPA